MIYAGIDVAKDKHDCFITNSDGKVLFQAFTIPNNRDGFDELYQKITAVTDDLNKVKVGLEATGHYSLILSILVYTFFSRMFDLMLPPVAKHSIVVA
jgi:transposase